MDKDVALFLQDSFRSVWSVELLLLLHGQPDRTWTTQQLVSELRSSEAVVQQGISDLSAAGLVVMDNQSEVRFAPASSDLRTLVERLAETYRVMPSAVRRLVILRPTETLRRFSDAFRIVKD